MLMDALVGFGEAAVKFQRDWLDNPQDLPFAPSVRTHALITLVQKGLQLCELESVVKEVRCAHGSVTSGFSSSLTSSGQHHGQEGYRIFGPPSRPNLQSHVDHGASGHGPRRNGLEPGDPMQADSTSNGLVPSAPFPPPPAATTITMTVTAPIRPRRTHLASSLIQVESEELSRLLNDTMDLWTLAHIDIPRTTNGRQDYHLLLCEIDALYMDRVSIGGATWPTQIWSRQRENPDDSVQRLARSSIIMQKHDLFTGDGRPWVASAMSWRRERGTRLALAAFNDEDMTENQITVWSRDGTLTGSFAPSFMSTLCLRWNRPGDRILEACTDGKSAAIRLWDVVGWCMAASLSFPSPIEDACWWRDQSFIVACERTIEIYQYDGHRTIELVQRHQMPHQRKLRLLEPDSISDLFATATAEMTIEVSNPPCVPSHHPFVAFFADAIVRSLSQIWNPEGHVHTFVAHTETITALEWVPPLAELRHRFAQGAPPAPRRRLASGSMDGTVCIWNAIAPWQCLHKFSFSQSRLPVLSLAFHPKMELLAAASYHTILIWNLLAPELPPEFKWVDVGSPRGSLDANAETTGGRHQTARDVDEPEVPSRIEWDAMGRKLAFIRAHKVRSILWRLE